MRWPRLWFGAVLALGAAALSSCAEEDAPANAAHPGRAEINLPAAEPAPGEAYERKAFFGDLHVHSGWSFDAYAADVNATPSDAYRYAQGMQISHISGKSIRLAGPPLDFIALTDHSEYLGVQVATANPDHPIHRQPLIQTLLGPNEKGRRLAWKKIYNSFSNRRGMPALVSDQVLVPAWRRLVELANEQNNPGKFTAFVGFEYTPNPYGQNLHRNVLFRGDSAPNRPFSAMDSINPEDLWDWMDRVRDQGAELLAIPHNPNGSNGLMFAETRHDGTPVDRDWIEQRARNEPVAEVTQIKGTSETHPTLSPDDEWASFEIADWRTTRADLPSQPKGSYLRDALKTGLALAERHGRNPYELGMLGSTDGHNASSPFEESNYTGKIGSSDATPERRLGRPPTSTPDAGPATAVATFWSASGLAGIWAGENTRSALFDAIRRRETFATSGPRIRVQLFAGWDFEAFEATREIDRVGYERGVPMGGVLERPATDPRSDAAPRLLVAAHKDPLEANLERIQVVKGWLSEGETYEQVFDVACAGGTQPDPIRHRCSESAPEPDLTTCAPAPEAGAAELIAWWRDPEFDPLAPSFYYVRVLQVPTCRWSTFDAIRLGRPRPQGVPATLQERAITSPIWIEVAEPAS